MPKIAFIGAGSFGFTRKLVKDVLTFPLLEGSEIALMDIDAERLDFATRAIKRIVEVGEYPARVTATMDRVEALARRRLCGRHHPGWLNRCLAARYRDPNEVRRRYECR